MYHVSHTSLKHASRWAGNDIASGYSMYVSVYDTLQWTNIPTRVHSHFPPSVPGTGSGSTMKKIRIKWLLKLIEQVSYNVPYSVIHGKSHYYNIIKNNNAPPAVD